MEKRSAYNMRLHALQLQVTAEVEGARQRYEAYLEELAVHEEDNARNFAATYRFGQLRSLAIRAAGRGTSPETFNEFKSELKAWLKQTDRPIAYITSLGLVTLAERNNVPAEQFIKELVTFVRSPECTLPTDRKKELIDAFEGLLRLTLGSEPKLYGRTLDDKEFQWDDLRKKDNEKYVLIKFTATWCGPCQLEIPGMLDAYEKYKDKGLEIISVYMWEVEDENTDPAATIKKYVEEKKLPWIIISEPLSKKAGHPEFGNYYGVSGVPEMVLVNKAGKIIMQDARGAPLKAKLREIFR